MKQKTIILGTLVILCLLCTGHCTYRLRHEHNKHVAEWDEGARVAFKESLRMEIINRLKESNTRTFQPLKEEISDSILIITDQDGKTYHIENTKYENSLIKEHDERMLVAVLLSDKPLSIDTLALHWDSCLLAKKIVCDKQIRYIYTDWDLNNDTLYAKADIHKGLDSLTVCYLGGRCEHELMAFISYPHWFWGASKGILCILVFPWILFALLAWQYSKLERWFRQKLVREKVRVVLKEKIIEIEKEIYVSNVPMNKVDVFKLPDGTLFNSSAKYLSKGGIQHSIQPQTVCLLKLFINNSEYKVTATEICRTLWQEEREKNKLYVAIQRLRNDLKAVNSDLTIDCIVGVYELK